MIRSGVPRGLELVCELGTRNWNLDMIGTLWELAWLRIQQESVFSLHKWFARKLLLYLQNFVVNTSLFSKFFDKHTSRFDLNNKLEIKNNWAFHWKMESTPDKTDKLRNYTFVEKLVTRIILILLLISIIK